MSARHTVLIVEDEVGLRAVLADYLRQSGFEILEARNAAEAKDIMEGHGVKIDLVFSDVRMPGGADGISFGQWIRKSFPEIPIILATGYAGSANDAFDMFPGGRVLLKPYDFEALVTEIRDAIVEKRR